MILDFDKLMYPQCTGKQQRQKPYDLEAMRKAYRDVFSSDHGKLVLADIAQRGLLHTVSFTGESPTTAFNEGKRALALEILYLLNPNPIPNKAGDGPHDSTTPFEFD